MVGAYTALFAIVVPIISALAIVGVHFFFPKEIGRTVKKAIGVLAGIITLYLVLSLVGTGIDTRTLELFGITFAVRADPLALVFSFVSALFGLLALVYNTGFFTPQNRAHEGGNEFRSSFFMLLFLGAMQGVVFSENLLQLFVFYELISLCSYGLISYWYHEFHSRHGAMKCLMMTHIGSLSLLVGSLLQYGYTNTFMIHGLSQSLFAIPPATLTIVMLLFILAALPKAVQFPFHSWLEEATYAPTPATAFLHSAALVKAGIYILARFFSDVFMPYLSTLQPTILAPLVGNLDPFHAIIALVGATTIVVGVSFGFFQEDIKKIIACGTISQLGYMVLALGAGGALGTTAALFHMVNHAFSWGLLFFCAGAVMYRTGLRDMRKMSGLLGNMPITAGTAIVAALAISSVPPLSDFVSKWLIFETLINLNAPLLFGAAFIGSILTAGIAIKMVQIYFGPRRFKVGEVGPALLLPQVGSMGMSLFLGVFPQVLLTLFIIPAASMAFGSVPISISRFGLLQSPIGFLSSTVAGIAIFAGIVIGYLLFLSAHRRVDIYLGGLKPEKIAYDSSQLYFGVNRGLNIPRITVLDPDTYYRKAIGLGFALSERLSKMESRIDGELTGILGGGEEEKRQ